MDNTFRTTLCDTCSHKDTCKYTEDMQKLTISLDHVSDTYPNIFSVRPKCNKFLSCLNSGTIKVF